MRRVSVGLLKKPVNNISVKQNDTLITGIDFKAETSADESLAVLAA